MQNYSEVVIRDCFQSMDPFCLMALSMTCRDYRRVFKVSKKMLVGYISNNRCESNEIIDWIYSLFGKPSYGIMLAINDSIRDKVVEHYLSMCPAYSNHYTEKILQLIHVSNIECMNYHKIVQITSVVSFKISCRIMEDFEKEIGFYKFWVNGNYVMPKLQSILGECAI